MNSLFPIAADKSNIMANLPFDADTLVAAEKADTFHLHDDGIVAMLNPSPIKPSPSLTSEEEFGVGGGTDGQVLELKDPPPPVPAPPAEAHPAAAVPGAAPPKAAAAAAAPTDLTALAAVAVAGINDVEPKPLAQAPPMPKLPSSLLQLDPISQYRMAQLMASAALAASGHLHVRPQFLKHRQPQPLPANSSVPMAFYHHNPHLVSQYQQHPFAPVPAPLVAAAAAPAPIPLPFSQHPIVHHGSEIWAEMKAQQQKLQEEHERRQRNAAVDSMLADAVPGGSDFEMPSLPGQMPSLPGMELPPLPGMEMPSLPGQELAPLPGMEMPPLPGHLINPGQAPLVYHPAESLDQYHGRAPGSSLGGTGPGAVVAGAGGVGIMDGAGTTGDPTAPVEKPKKRGRGRPKGSKNKPKPPGYVKPSKRATATKVTKPTKAAKPTIVKPTIVKPTIVKPSIAMPESGGRRCQLRFTATGEELPFTSKKDGRVALTTNTPREVEAVDPVTNQRIHLFNSCSDAARITGINRTKMSRTCRKGGDVLESNSHGELLYRYTEFVAAGTSPDSDSEDEDVGIGITAAAAAAAAASARSGEDQEEDPAALAAAAVAASVAAGDAMAYAAALQAQKKAADSATFFV